VFELGIIIAVVLAVWAYVKMSKGETQESSKVTEDVSVEASSPAETVEEVIAVEPEPEIAEESLPAETAEEVIAVEPEREVAEESLPVETAEEVIAVEPASDAVAADSVSSEEVELSKAEQGIPEDSTLKRHYLQNLAAEQGVEFSATASDSLVRLPEDAVLKRHFIQKITADIAEQLADRPTDSTLVRHYDAQLASLVEQQLQKLG